MAKASDFHFGMQLGFAKAYHKITTKRKSGRSYGLREFPQNLGVPFNISVMAEASDFKFGIELKFAKLNYKITPKDESGRGHRLGSSQNLGIPLNIYAMAETSDFKFGTQLGLPIRPIIKSQK